MSESSGTVIYRQSDYAHGVRRLIAVVIDVFISFFLLSVPIGIATALWVPKDVMKEHDPVKQRRETYEAIGPERYWITAAIGFLLPIGYQVGMRRLRGGTLGYRIARIRLIRHDGNPPGWKQLMIRIGLMIAGIFTLGLVFLPTFLRKKRQAVHDQFAKTWMVRARAKPEGPGQFVYKTQLFGTFPVTMTDIELVDESTHETPAVVAEADERTEADVAMDAG